MSHHRAQVESVLRRSVQEVLSRGLSDPRIKGVITITRVEVSPDGRQGTVWCSVMPREHASLSIKGLGHASGRIHSELKKKLEMRRVPRLIYRLDKSLKREAEVLSAINEARRRDEEMKHNRTDDESGSIRSESTEDDIS
tara:strand:- start:980 stop:1399 length:420 start_codon:yes stop_codon:yes gene_type:complete